MDLNSEQFLERFLLMIIIVGPDEPYPVFLQGV